MNSNWRFRITRFRGVLRVLLGSRMAIAGLLILGIYLGLAIFAPLVTQAIYGTSIDPNDSIVSGPLARPTWWTYFSEGSHLSQNIALDTNPGFYSDPTNTGWEFTSSNTLLRGSFDQTTNSIGRGGSFKITLDRTSSPAAGNYTANFEKTFTYPYSGSASRFLGSIAVLTPTASVSEPVTVTVYIRNLTTNIVYNLTDTQTCLSSGVTTNCNKSWGIYPLENATAGWQRPTIDSRGTAVTAILPQGIDPATLIFSASGKYTYGVTVTLQDAQSSKTPLVVNLDEVNLQLYGTAWGLLGTDFIGRDVFTQLIYGARISLLVGLLSAGIGIAVGLVVGLAAGYMGKLVDEVLMRFTDMLLVLPTLPLLIILVATTGGRSTIAVLILVIGFLGWMGFARVVRAQVLTLKERPFVEAAKAAGAGTGHITTKHIIPNIIGLIYVNLALSVPGAILSEAALSFLGLGDPAVMSWGKMLNLVQDNAAQKAWWWVIPPGLSIALVSLSFVMIGFALDSIFNPRLRQRR